MLKISQLRKEAYWAWESLCAVKGVFLGAPESIDLPEAEADRLPFTNRTFKDEIRQQFGDLRRKATWEQAAIHYTAHSMVQSYMEPYMIVGFMASPQFMTSAIREHYGDQVLELMLQFPETVDIVKRGLEQLYYESDRQEDHDVAQKFFQTVGKTLPPRDSILPLLP
ncbi:hypothetical protein C7B61_00190 [filamentous cyanobacterium CCP1]|nr:hypothetical protein C7B61_00190 [filamentous cyanobacterium CCP1]